MIDQTADVLTRLKRMDDARLRPTEGGLPKTGLTPRRKLSLAFGRPRENEEIR